MKYHTTRHATKLTKDSKSNPSFARKQSGLNPLIKRKASSDETIISALTPAIPSPGSSINDFTRLHSLDPETHDQLSIWMHETEMASIDVQESSILHLKNGFRPQSPFEDAEIFMAEAQHRDESLSQHETSSGSLSFLPYLIVLASSRGAPATKCLPRFSVVGALNIVAILLGVVWIVILMVGLVELVICLCSGKRRVVAAERMIQEDVDVRVTPLSEVDVEVESQAEKTIRARIDGVTGASASLESGRPSLRV